MKALAFVVASLTASAASAGWNLNLASGWRVTGGASCSSGLKTDLRVNGARALSAMPAFARPSGMSRSDAEAVVRAFDTGGRVELPDGAFVDPHYAGEAVLPDYTWNWYVPAGAYSGGTMNFSADWVESTSVWSGDLDGRAGADGEMPGFNVELQRNLGQWGRFGLDMGFGFSYSRRNNAFRASSAVRRTDTVERGSASASVTVDPAWAGMAQNADGSYGVGTYDGPGPLLPISAAGASAFTFGSRVDGVTSATHSLFLDSSADYEEIELTLTAKPYYDVTDWFRVVGTLGAAVNRGELDFDLSAASGGRCVYAESERFSQWDCFGVGGLGGMFHGWNVCLGFDFLARFFGRDLEVDGRSVSGSVRRSPWTFRVYAGFEF